MTNFAILPAQCRAARAILGWSQERLAGVSSIAITTLRNFETGRHRPRRSVVSALARVFADEGVIFVKEVAVYPRRPDAILVGVKISQSRAEASDKFENCARAIDEEHHSKVRIEELKAAAKRKHETEEEQFMRWIAERPRRGQKRVARETTFDQRSETLAQEERRRKLRRKPTNPR